MLQSIFYKIKKYMNTKAPIGTIMMFAGGTAPKGWMFCNGKTINYQEFLKLDSNLGETSFFQLENLLGKRELPNLQTRFIKGEKGENVGMIGNSSKHTHDLVYQLADSVHAHQAGGHSHNLPPTWKARPKENAYDHPWPEGAARSVDLTNLSNRNAKELQSVAGHTHTIKLESITCATTENTGQNRPAWYALNFIIRVIV